MKKFLTGIFSVLFLNFPIKAGIGIIGFIMIMCALGQIQINEEKTNPITTLTFDGTCKMNETKSKKVGDLTMYEVNCK